MPSQLSRIFEWKEYYVFATHCGQILDDWGSGMDGYLDSNFNLKWVFYPKKQQKMKHLMKAIF